MTENNINAKIQEMIDSNDVFLFMKGSLKSLNVVSQLFRFEPIRINLRFFQRA